MRRMSSLLVASAALALVVSDVAHAAPRTSGKADAKSSGGSAETTAAIETSEGPATGNGRRRRSGASLSCRYSPPVGTMIDDRTYGSPREVFEAGWSQYVIICEDAAGQEVVNDIRTYDPAPAAPAVDPEVLAEQAAARLDVAPPEVQLSPKAGVDQIVQLRTWMWVANWEPDSATASVPSVSATVTATPASVTWDMGNGDEVVCSGPGTPFDFSRPEEEQSTDCSYTYRHSSTSQPGGVYQLSATMTYDVSWSASGAPGGGALPAVSETTTFPLRVLEIHAVEGVGSGGS